MARNNGDAGRPSPCLPARAPPGKYPLTDAVRGTAYQDLTVESTFTQIYATDAWGKGSGAGSVPVHCLKWIEFMRKFIRAENVHSVVDLGCGDWQFSPYIYHDLNVEYVGYDVVKPVIEANKERWGPQGYDFRHLEFSTHVPEIHDAELYVIKDVLQHWSSARITAFLTEVLQSKTRLRYFLVCNCAEPEDWPEDDIGDGGWRPLFASRPPLSLFTPEVLFHFPSLPNKKEVCLLRPLARATVAAPATPGPSGAARGRARSSARSFACFEGGYRRARAPTSRPRFVPL